MDRILFLMLWLWAIVAAVVSAVVFLLTWAVAAGLFYLVWHAMETL